MSVPEENVLEAIRQTLEEISPEPLGPIDGSTELSSFGFDSLALSELVFELEERLEVAIENDELAELATVGDLLALVQEKAQ